MLNFLKGSNKSDVVPYSDIKYETLKDITESKNSGKLITGIGLNKTEQNKLYSEFYNKIKNAIASVPSSDTLFFNKVSKIIKDIVDKYDDDVLFGGFELCAKIKDMEIFLYDIIR